MVGQIPLPLQAVQSDGGSEFLTEFGPTVAELQITHYFNRPNYPQGNGRIETVRLHQALGYKTPEQFYQEWLKPHPMRKEVLSDMS